MKIIAFEPGVSDAEKLGLTQVRFKRLGQVVVLAGPNGGGKSRILNILMQYAQATDNRMVARKSHLDQIRAYESVLREHAAGHRKDDLSVVKTWHDQIESNKIQLAKINAITLDQETEKIQVVNFVPKELRLADPASMARGVIIRHADKAARVGMDSMHDNALAYIQNKQDRHHHVTHQNYQGLAEEKNQIEHDYETLCSLIESLLQKKLERSADGEAIIFGQPLGKCPLSDGQKVLVQFAVAVHPSHDDQALALIMDEPENHLHPSALILALDRIRSALPRAQLWVATHSVPLLAHLYADSPESLHFVEGGTVKYAGDKPQIVLKGLIGDEDEQTKLIQFIDLPHNIAASQFAAGCLFKPNVAGHQHDDPQLRQIRQILRGTRLPNAPLRVLDFGAGKGRLLAGLAEENSALPSEMDYVAFDAIIDDKVECERQLESVYGNTAGRWFREPDDLFVIHGEASFDVVVMCNVLHEIDPDKWLDVLGQRGLIYRSLTNGGFLLIVEDLRIPSGEMPNANGFFLLDTVHLQKLFNITDRPDIERIKCHDLRGDGRLKVHVIPKEFVAWTTAESRRNALVELRDTAVRRIQSLRATAHPSFKEGQLHALWSQQYANCALYLRD